MKEVQKWNIRGVLLIENPYQRLADSLKINIMLTIDKTIERKFDDMSNVRSKNQLRINYRTTLWFDDELWMNYGFPQAIVIST